MNRYNYTDRYTKPSFVPALGSSWKMKEGPINFDGMRTGTILPLSGYGNFKVKVIFNDGRINLWSNSNIIEMIDEFELRRYFEQV